MPLAAVMEMRHAAKRVGSPIACVEEDEGSKVESSL